MLKKALLWDADRNQIEPRTGFLQFNVKTKKVCICFASFSSEQEHFSHDVYIAALYSSFGRKKNPNRSCSMKKWCQNFRRNCALAIAVIVTSHSSTFEYTMSIHVNAVHAGAERNVCYIEVSTETPQTTTNPSQTLLPVYKLAHLPLPHSKSSLPRPPPSHTHRAFSSAFRADALQM